MTSFLDLLIHSRLKHSDRRDQLFL